MDYSQPGSFVHGILQARILECIASPPPGDLPNVGIEPTSLRSPALAGGFSTMSATWEAQQGQGYRILSALTVLSITGYENSFHVGDAEN